MSQNTFLLGLTTGVALCTVSYYLLSTIKECLSIVYPTSPAQRDEERFKFISASPRDFSPPPPLYQDDVFTRLESERTVPSAKLSKMVRHLVSEMKKGLQYPDQTLKMLPSFVISRPTGTETGTVLALDLGGSNFRVCLVNLEGQGLVRMKQRKYVVSDELKKSTGIVLFDFFADSIARFLVELGLDMNTPRPLGFTFSFPVEQIAIDQGYLMHWNKGFTCSGVEGVDVGALLNEALARKGVAIRVNAIVNDTVGTLIAHAYNDPQTYIGVILGTGTNAAYVEKVDEIAKTAVVSSTGEIIINTEVRLCHQFLNMSVGCLQ